MRKENIKLLEKNGSYSTYKGLKDGEEIIFTVWFHKNENLEEILKESTIMYTNKSIKELKENNPLITFELDIRRKEIVRLNTSIYKYFKFFKKNKVVSSYLKSAYITVEEDYFYIGVESFDDDSMVTEESVEVIKDTVYRIKDELEKILNREYSHMEVY